MQEHTLEPGNAEWPATTPSNEQRAFFETSEGMEDLRYMHFVAGLMELMTSNEFQNMGNDADGDSDNDSDDDDSSTWTWDDDNSRN